MLMYSEDLPLFYLCLWVLCPSVHPFVHHILSYLCICWQIIWKEWHNEILHAYVFRWLTPNGTAPVPTGIVISCIHPSVQLSMSLGFGIVDKSLRWKDYILACWCIQMTYSQFIHAYGYYCPPARPFTTFSASFTTMDWSVDFNSSTSKWLHPLQSVGSNYYPLPNVKGKFFMMSSNGNIFRVNGPLLGDPLVTGRFPHSVQWRGAFSLICTWTNGWANNRDAGHLRRHPAHYVVSVMSEWIDNLIPQFTGDVILQIFY